MSMSGVQFVTSQAKIGTIFTICTQEWTLDEEIDVVKDVEGLGGRQV